jgi:uncharacterized caspase-like protein
MRALALIAGLLLAIVGNAYGADKRVALVVGNGNYEHAPQLDNPIRDARLIASTLKELGFALIGGGAQENLERSSLEQAVRSFGRAIGPGTIALFYYSGHAGAGACILHHRLHVCCTPAGSAAAFTSCPTRSPMPARGGVGRYWNHFPGRHPPSLSRGAENRRWFYIAAALHAGRRPP